MEAIDRYITHRDWITLTLVVIGMGIAMIHLINYKRLKALLTLLYSRFYFSDYDFNSGNLLKRFNVILVIISILILGLSIIKFNDSANFLHAESTGFLFLKLIVLISLYIILKYAIENFIAWTFDISSWYKSFSYVKTSYFLSFHLLFLLALIPALYYLKDNSIYIYFIGIIYLILLILRYIQTFSYFSRELVPFLFYFILYLCILEIMPFILIYKWVI